MLPFQQLTSSSESQLPKDLVCIAEKAVLQPTHDLRAREAFSQTHSTLLLSALQRECQSFQKISHEHCSGAKWAKSELLQRMVSLIHGAPIRAALSLTQAEINSQKFKTLFREVSESTAVETRNHAVSPTFYSHSLQCRTFYNTLTLRDDST